MKESIMSTGNNHRLVTIDDLENFKQEIIVVIRTLQSTTAKDPVKKWLKSAEVRKRLGISPGKLQAIRESGLLPYTRIGGNIYYDEDDLFRLYHDHKTNKG